MRGFIHADARSLYGPGPALGEGGGAPELRLVAGDPEIETAPIASGMATTLTDDPAFWLVVVIGAVAVLAIVAEPGA